MSRDRIFSAALAIVDQETLSGLTMRRLATDLGVDPMALYYHVDDRDALLDGVGALVIEQVPPLDDLTGPWDEQVQIATRRFRATLLAHAQAVPIIATRPASTRYLADLAQTTLTFLLRLGLEIDQATDLLWLLNAYVIGHVVNQIPESGHETRTPDHEDERFERGLQVILVGFAATAGLEITDRPTSSNRSRH